jgi:hypothetical protein
MTNWTWVTLEDMGSEPQGWILFYLPSDLWVKIIWCDGFEFCPIESACTPWCEQIPHALRA